MTRAIRFLALLLCAAATGCASVSGGNVQKMYVQAQTQTGAAVAGADCTLSNDKGSWRLTAPGDTSIVRSNKRMEVKCDKQALPQGVVSVESSTRGAMFGNIILGGVVGAVIDHNSGAAYEYPEMIKVIMGRMMSLDVPKGNTPAATAEAQKNAAARSAAAQSTGAHATQPAAAVPSMAAPPPVASIATGYARVDDVDAVPYLSDKGREDYRQWVGRPTPKAFAVATDGAWFGAWSLKPTDASHPTDPSERAMLLCRQRTRTTCMMYAVNGSVVWTKPASAVAAPAAAAAAGSSTLVRVVSASEAATPAALPGSTALGHSRVVPPPSGYAALDNVDAVPVNPAGKPRYTHYLTLPPPKAFVVYETGGWRLWSNSPDSMTTLLDTCAREGRKCWLYAVDDRVVWREDIAQRIGRADQLGR
jgi:hypothetical protein